MSCWLGVLLWISVTLDLCPESLILQLCEALISYQSVSLLAMILGHVCTIIAGYK